MLHQSVVIGSVIVEARLYDRASVTVTLMPLSGNDSSLPPWWRSAKSFPHIVMRHGRHALTYTPAPRATSYEYWGEPIITHIFTCSRSILLSIYRHSYSTCVCVLLTPHLQVYTLVSAHSSTALDFTDHWPLLISSGNVRNDNSVMVCVQDEELVYSTDSNGTLIRKLRWPAFWSFSRAIKLSSAATSYSPLQWR